MKTLSGLLVFIALLYLPRLHAQPSVSWIQSVPGRTITVYGDLGHGLSLSNLNWAWSSQNACFVATQQHKFSGHHVLYQAELPAHSEMTIRVIPNDPEDNFSIYAYSGSGEHIVPSLPHCVSCEADYKWDYKYRGKTQDHSRKVSLRAVKNPYIVTIGVVGAEGLSTGRYSLELSLTEGVQKSKEAQAAVPKFRIESRKGEALTYEGKLEDGVPIQDLSWAWDSQNACFVSIRQDKFNGHHLLYTTELPPWSEIEVMLSPNDEKDNMSLYAYSQGGTDIRFVPDLPSCISCEASFQQDLGQASGPKRKVSLRSGKNPLNIVIGVAGAAGLKSGDYRLTLKIL